MAFDLVNVDYVSAVQYTEVDGLLSLSAQLDEEWVGGLSQWHPTQQLAAQFENFLSQVISAITIGLDVACVKERIEIPIGSGLMDANIICQLDRRHSFGALRQFFDEVKPLS